VLAIADNPPQLSPGVDSIADLRGRWFIAHTRAKMERMLVRHLAQHDVGYYLPLLERVTISSGKKRRSLAPMFNSYVFFCGDVEARYAAISSNYLCQIIEVVRQEHLVSELLGIEKAIKGGAKLDLYPFAVEGRRCRVIAGPFKGLEGVVVHRTGTIRLVLQVTMLQSGVALEIDIDLLEPVE
jgi:transcription antitermination factor NusG